MTEIIKTLHAKSATRQECFEAGMAYAIEEELGEPCKGSDLDKRVQMICDYILKNYESIPYGAFQEIKKIIIGAK